MKRFANLLKKFSLHDLEREATQGNPRHAADIKQEIEHDLEEIEREEGRGHKKPHKWSDEQEHSHWTY
jgi:hypothetical protein